MVYIIPTKNVMTTKYYYKIIFDAFKSIGQNAIICESTDKYYINREDIIVVGGIKEAFRFFVKGYRKVIIWFQGINPEEREMQGASKIKIIIMNLIEKTAIKRAYFRIFVSKSMKEHYQKKYRINFDEKRYYIMPCFNENHLNVNALKCKNQYSEKIVFVYCGGTGVWQCLDETINLCQRIENSSLGRISEFRFFTNDVKVIKNKLEEKGLKNVICQYAEQDHLPEVLEDCDFGFVLRNDNVVNNVATPTKLSTYLSNGVVPIVSTAVYDFCNVTENIHAVIRCDSLQPDDIFQNIKNYIDNHKSVEIICNEYSKIFDSYYSTDYHTKCLGEKIDDLLQQK